MSHRALVFSLVVAKRGKLGAAGVLVSAQSQQQEVSLRPSLLFGNDPAPPVSRFLSSSSAAGDGCPGSAAVGGEDAGDEAHLWEDS